MTAGGLAQVLGEALAVAPGLAAATHLETRVGFRPMGPDAKPLLGPVPGVGGLVVATGLGPTGLTMGPCAAPSPPGPRSASRPASTSRRSIRCAWFRNAPHRGGPQRASSSSSPETIRAVTARGAAAACGMPTSR